MKQITILYFGQLRQAAGLAEDQVQSAATTPRELLAEQATMRGFSYHESSLRFARNEAFCPADATLADGDTIAFMPPMAGG